MVDFIITIFSWIFVGSLALGVLVLFIYLIALLIYPFCPKKFKNGCPYGPIHWWFW